MNVSAKIDLLKLNGAFPCNFKYEDGNEYECICIPVKFAMLYRSEKSAYLDTVIKPSQEGKFGYDHYVRQNVSKEAYNAMTDEQRKQIPYLGNARAFGDSNGNGNAKTGQSPVVGAAPVAPKGYDF